MRQEWSVFGILDALQTAYHIERAFVRATASYKSRPASGLGQCVARSVGRGEGTREFTRGCDEPDAVADEVALNPTRLR
jgi:hypothetical protein